MKLQDKLLQLKAGRKAILAANFYNFETLSGIMQAATNLKTPLILQLSESSIRYMGLPVAVAMVKAAIREFRVEAWLHLDHGSSVSMVSKCLDEGFDSVMIDASEKSLEENIEITSQVVEIAAGYHANVEAELGFVPKLGQKYKDNEFTRPEDARKFVESTGINALAVAIGSAHGFYKQAPKLDIELLARISQTVPSPLVLHGSSGIPDTMLIEAIENGICKINLATETKNVFMLALKERLRNNDEIDLRIVFPYATKAVINLIEKKLKTINKIR
ncbi:MAG: ketose-bisphosphate aldolase [Bacteroidetes bacterium GWE2_41_25]|nr:MAG: ketose-bisphosphate aldolase [Bacteroidetes bacterium GWA2_40_15]OFX95115.1 MAG: ketose-bisphosphate aldolase [Bacteroidetes bacterium GWC2_40_22]OFY10878.1 MAG: ketose-bisphosphate aldolase [Bacteroidetes bacterium GWE2_41_25]OFY57446.1 MAG: ketose-bisphosphate aldolase [Bacteroidetes bacterium GWF2_41_9]HBH83284.1 ketose-bisphosphate aldolase [Bacteroidales bacterium]